MTTSAPIDSVAPDGAGQWTVAIFALMGLGLGLVLFAFRGPTYQAQTLVAVSNPAAQLVDEVEVVLSPTVVDVAAVVLGFEPKVSVTSAQVAGLLTITVTADDPELAAAGANMVAETYVQVQQGAAANIAQTAVAPTSASGLGPLVFAAIGTVAGALIGMLVGPVQRRRLAAAAAAQAQSATPAHVDVRSSPPLAVLRDRVPERPSETAVQATPATQTQPVQPENPAQPVPPAQTPQTAQPVEPAQPVPPSVTPPHHQPAPAAPPPPQPEPATPMKPPTRSFSDASSGSESNRPEPSWVPDATADAALDRRAHEAELETTRYELALAHNEDLARLDVEHKRQTADQQNEVARLNKQLREQAIRLKNRAGNDQTRTGDLEAQVDALEIELTGLRETLERERIGHAKQLTEERGAADRALDNARREFREEVAKHLHAHRQALSEQRAELDQELAADRTRHAVALDQEHQNYEAQLRVDRQRAEAKLQSANERHNRELDALRAASRNEVERQANQHKATIQTLRGSRDGNDAQLRELEKENRLLRAEIGSQEKQARHDDRERATALQRATEELALSRTELEAERQRNSALRADVLRRSAEAHQTIDRAVEERTAQLAELEASVTRQRQYADTRVREISAAAEEQARQSAAREASLTATVSRLKREVAELKKIQSLNTP